MAMAGIRSDASGMVVVLVLVVVETWDTVKNWEDKGLPCCVEREDGGRGKGEDREGRRVGRVGGRGMLQTVRRG